MASRPTTLALTVLAAIAALCSTGCNQQSAVALSSYRAIAQPSGPLASPYTAEIEPTGTLTTVEFTPEPTPIK